MINSNELRIGNIVAYPKSGPNPIRNGHDLDMARTNGVVAEDITEEWLRKLGFQTTPGNYNTFLDYFIQIGQTKTLTIYISENEHGAYLNETGTVVSIHLTSNVKYVHQLQNLYFALSGEDLLIVNADKETR